MKGLHHIIVESARLKYTFDVRRNITILQGDSATGKTTLIELLRDYAADRSGKSVQIQSDVPCVVFGGSQDLWLPVIQSIHDSVVFIDEDYTFIYSKEFADVISHSSNYFVLITREGLPNLPYSIQEIYGIRTSGKYSFPHKIYHEFYPIYPSEELNLKKRGSDTLTILTEDGKAGYQFFQALCSNGKCISCEGNSNIYSMLLSRSQSERLLVVADGAAFGAWIANVIAFAQAHGSVMLYFPESFEWLILKSGLIGDAETKDMLRHPEDFINSAEYISWERFFTDHLQKISVAYPGAAYRKNFLAPFYLTEKSKARILKVFPEMLQAILKSPE